MAARSRTPSTAWSHCSAPLGGGTPTLAIVGEAGAGLEAEAEAEDENTRGRGIENSVADSAVDVAGKEDEEEEYEWGRDDSA